MVSITVKEAMWAFLTAGVCWIDIAAVHPADKPFLNLQSVVMMMTMTMMTMMMIITMMNIIFFIQIVFKSLFSKILL